MKQPLNEQLTRMQKLAGIITENQINEESYPSDKMLELVKMYVDNYFDEGMGAEAALRKVDEILDGKLDDYDKSFLKGKEDLEENEINIGQENVIKQYLNKLRKFEEDNTADMADLKNLETAISIYHKRLINKIK